MAYPYKNMSIFSLLTAVFLLNGCTQFIEGDQAWPGVSAGTTSSAPDFTAPVAGGQFGQRAPSDVLQNTYGYRGEDLSATAPGAMFRGRFMDVASALLRSFARTRPAPWGTFYKGNRVLLVVTQEDENAD